MAAVAECPSYSKIDFRRAILYNQRTHSSAYMYRTMNDVYEQKGNEVNRK